MTRAEYLGILGEIKEICVDGICNMNTEIEQEGFLDFLICLESIIDKN